MELKITNTKQFQGNMRKLARYSRQELEKALELVAYKIQGDTQENAPVDTGRLKNSYSVYLSKPNLTATIYTDIEYAPFVEYGTTRQNPQPHLEPAVLSNKGAWVGAISTAVKKAAERV